MGQLSDDILKWTLDVNGSPARKELTEVSNSTNKLERANTSLAKEMAKLEAHGKKGGKEWKAYEAQIKANSTTIVANKKRMGELRKEVGLNSLTARELRKEMRSLKQTMDGIDPNSAKWKQMNSQYTAMQSRLGQVRGGMGKVNAVFGAFKKLAPWLGIAAVGAALKGVVSKAIQTRTEFSRYEAVLTNTLGSQKAANTEFAKLKKFAADTPFQLNEMTNAYVKLTNQGFQPTMDDMQSMGDLAGSMGKSFDQWTEAFLDARQGENERLKEFGIRAAKHGDIIAYTFKGVTTEVKNDAESIDKYLLSLGKMEGVAGGMDKISKTIGGAISNNADATDNWANALGKRLEPAVVSGLLKWTGFLNASAKWLEIPIEDKLLEESKQVNALAVELTDANTTEDRRHQILTELKEINPKIVAGLDAENLSVETLKNNMKLYNDELTNRIILANLTEEEEKYAAKAAKAKTDLYNEQYKLRQLIGKVNPDIALGDGTLEEKAKKIQDILKKTGNTGFYGDEAVNEDKLNLVGIGNSLQNIIAYRKELEGSEGLQADFSKRMAAMKEMMGLQEELESGKKKKKPNSEAEAKVAAKAIEIANQQRILALKEQYGAEETMQEFYNARLLANEIAFLQAKLNLSKEEGDKLALQIQIIDKQIEYNSAIKSAVDGLKLKKEAVKEVNTKLLEEGKLTERNAEISANAAKQQEELNNKMTTQAQMIQTTTELVAQGLFDMMSGSEDAFKSFAKNILIFALEQLKVQAQISIASAAVQALASPESVATWGTAGVAKSLVLYGLIEAAFAGIEGLVSGAFSGSGKKEGGYGETGVSDDEVAGFYHANEFIGNAKSVRNPGIKRVYDIIDHAQKNGTVATLNLPAILGAGKKVGGYSTQPAAQTQANLTQPYTPNIDMDKFDKAVSKMMTWNPELIMRDVQKKLNRLDTIDNKTKLTE
jgi:hypothetical protein